MRTLLKVMLGLALLCVLIAASAVCWLYLYSGDIPNSAKVHDFAPTTEAKAAIECSTTVVAVIPYSQIGENVETATRAAEGNDRILALQIARGLFCDYAGQRLKWHLLEYKAAVQLQRRFTSDQLLTIYLNRAFFGNGIIGIQSASQHYYGKRSSELNVAQAAMVTGLLRSPMLYSPEHSPERAKKRRDAVIAAMVEKGTITAAQGQAAMNSDVR